MEEILINYFSQITPLSDTEKEALVKSMQIIHFKKGDLIVEEGQKNPNTFFVLQGLIRQYKMIDAEDITTQFYTEEQWILSPEGLGGENTSADNLICVEDSSVVVGDEAKAMNLFQKFPRFEKISRQIVEASFMEQQKLMTSYITDKPEQRYLKLMKSRPDVFQRVPQYDIATYIGVKPESLSRIRKKLVGKS